MPNRPVPTIPEQMLVRKLTIQTCKLTLRWVPSRKLVYGLVFERYIQLICFAKTALDRTACASKLQTVPSY